MMFPRVGGESQGREFESGSSRNRSRSARGWDSNFIELKCEFIPGFLSVQLEISL